MTGGSGKLVVALYGYPGSGKDTVASMLLERGGWERVAFADPMKEMLVAIDPYIGRSIEEVWLVRLHELLKTRTLEELKRDPQVGPEIRRLLQRTGKEGGRDVLGEDVWVNAALTRILTALDAGKQVVVTDTRFPNEYRAMCDLGAVIVAVRRPGYEACNGHDSEKHYGEFLPNYVLHNEGSLDDLRAGVDMLVRDAMLE